MMLFLIFISVCNEGLDVSLLLNFRRLSLLMFYWNIVIVEVVYTIIEKVKESFLA
jgi:hypothetical protein